MPEIQADTLIQGRTPDEVWTLVKDSSLVASRARHVVAVRPLSEQDKTFRINEWTVLLNGSEVTWRQREAAGPGLQLRFEQTAGDLEKLSGEWSLAADGEGTRVSFVLAYELGVDGLAPLLDPIWSQSFRAHADELLRALTACAA
ncbi:MULTISPECIES: type II toxin-antitoxin system RatA family toxin [Streptomyces]|uniref:Type II toxin-antitoxin system RatA family toxin n=1 Tax=Streptomyces flavovirens TaxID=52258 RepID=A0ABV8N225_9ACTN|nr:SRPBCC family protein [Streptomyces sp. MBT51]MBK3595049.1 SRPBCC family protein [Streptomyces sp. MBT51]HBF85253.1 cyclase/dehydrase [Streptomyces sp.]